MGPFLIAWLVGMGLNISHDAYNYKVSSGIGYNDPTKSPLPPKPGRLLIASGIYVGLAILAEAPNMRSTATLAAWGYNAAIGLRWASEYASNKGSNLKAGGSAWWSPPTASGDTLFPSGTSGTPTAKPTSTTPPASGSGPLVA